MDVGHPSLHRTCVEHVHNFTTAYWNVSITLHPPIVAEKEGSCDACMEHGDMHFGHDEQREQTSRSSWNTFAPLCQGQTNNMFQFMTLWHYVPWSSQKNEFTLN
jgi:hypothetical protein